MNPFPQTAIGKRVRRTFFAVALLLITAPVASAQVAPVSGLDDFVQNAMRDWDVPGAAVAIVKDDKVVYLKSFGVRKIGEQDPVNEHTMFAIGSATKAFTATVLGILVDQGKLKWDDPVSTRLRDFRFPTPELTARVTVRDLLSHRTGVGDNLPLYWGTSLSAHDLMQRLSSLEVHAGLRERFEYNNLMYLAAGEVVSAVTGIAWADFVRQRLLQPLGMASTVTDLKSLRNSDNLASGHGRNGAGGMVQVLPLMDFSNVASAGAILSNASDMAHWVRFQLGNGTYEGGKIVESSTLSETHTRQVSIPNERPFSLFFADNASSSYGLGWMLSNHQGHQVVQHGGSTDAMTSLVALMPDQRVGIVILTNLAGHWLPSAVMYQVFDAFLGNAAKDWNAEYLQKTR